MRRSKHDYRALSKVQCGFPGCKKCIKQNVVDRKDETDVLYCYPHFKLIEIRRKTGARS